MLSTVRKTGASLALCGVLAALAGCATVSDLAGIPRTGYQKDGTYVVSPDEEALACRQIRDRLDVLSSELKALPQRAAIEEQARPSTLTAAFGRMFGDPGDGLTATADFRRATAEAEALNALLVKKQCV